MAEEHFHDDDHSDLGPMDVRVRALETVLSQKGYVDPAALAALIDTYQTKIGPRNGARVVARAWVDPTFRQWLLADATAAIASLGYSGRQGEHIVAVENTPSRHNLVVCTLCSCYPWPVLGLPPVWYKSAPYRARAVKDPRGVLADATAAIASLGYSGRQGEHMVAVENTPSRHNLVVCTLCSCYPWPVLGLPPAWYKSAPYRARAVKDPRGVLADFGVRLPDATEIRVFDSTAEVRYLVIPQRPEGTDGMSEEALAELVTRDSMIGTGLARPPQPEP